MNPKYAFGASMPNGFGGKWWWVVGRRLGPCGEGVGFAALGVLGKTDRLCIGLLSWDGVG